MGNAFVGKRLWVCALLGLAFSLGPTGLTHAKSPSESLARRIKKEMASPGCSFGLGALKQLRGRHIVFIDGVMNELAQVINNYFYDSIEHVSELEISSSHLRFASYLPIPLNADLLFERLFEIYEQKQKPLIIVAHSMGGAEALYSLLSHPELMIHNTVERVILVEPSIGGSNLTTDMRSYVGPPLKWALGGGLRSLEPDSACANFEEVYARFLENLRNQFSDSVTFEAELKRISDRVYYVRSYFREDWPSLGVASIYLFARPKALGKQLNDGVLTLGQQKLNVDPPFGHDLGVVKADHIELVISGVFSSSTVARRRAFTRSILQMIYE